MNEEITTQLKVRNDGRVTLTVRLIGFDPSFLATIQERPNFQRRLFDDIWNAVIDEYAERSDL